MTSSILYVTEYNGVANIQPGGAPVAMGNLPPIAQYAVLGTTGGLMALAAISSGGAGLVTGTYVNQPVSTTAAGGQGATVNFTVTTAGTASLITIVNSGYGYTSGAFINIIGAATTAGSVLASIHIGTILPCGPPFQLTTQLVEISADGAGTTQPVVVIDTVLSSIGYNGYLTTLQGTLHTACGLRLSTTDRILRGVAPPLGAAPLSVIMGTAAS